MNKRYYEKPIAEVACQIPHSVLMGSLERPGGSIDNFEWDDLPEGAFGLYDEETDF